MASIIKNQILKHLSRFVKNLSSDKISLSTFKGEGELTNLELDEIVLTDLLALPSWMKLTHATCNKACIRIPWTKLKSVPILLSLDSVKIRVEACEELRQGGPSPQNAFPTSAGKYGFVNKVIDGITATVNSVEITFQSQAFESKVQISRIRLESQSPNWKKVDLQGTRLKCMERGETLVFKAMEWQTLRLEARSTSDRNLAPLRLLTNQAKAHIVIKKKLSDCQVLGCRLSLLLDDLLWVLTDSQILAALHFINSISGLIKQSTELTQRFKAARKLESLPEYQAQLSQTSALKRDIRTDAARHFDTFDVKETSYHFLCEKIDLHFCDDPGSGRSNHEDLKDGGAFQVSLMQVLLDFYPYHLAKGERRSWPRYTPDNALAQWLTNSLNSFRIALIEAISASSMHSPLARTQNNPLPSGGDTNPVKKTVTDQFGKLMSTCLVLKIQDLRLFKVTTSSKQTVPQPFLSSYIDRPKDLQTVHAEFTWFYYPGEICFPLPSPKVFAHLYPFQVHLDTCTILWLNCFISNLQNAMSKEIVEPAEPDYMDVRVELIMPKVVFENKKLYPSQKERPQSLHFQVSRLVLSNYRSNETGSLHELTQCLELLQRGDLAYGTDFPSKDHDVPLIAEKFILHAEGRDKIRQPTKINGGSFHEIAPYLTKDMLNTEPRDVWYVFMDPFWADFRVETKRKKNSSEQNTSKIPKDSDRDLSLMLYPFIDSLPVSAWLHLHEEPSSKLSSSLNSDTPNGETVPKTQKSIKAIFSANGIASLQLTHYQYLFLMRMIEAISELSLYLTYDLEQIIGQQIYNNLVTVLGYIPTTELSLLFPPSVPGKQESPSMELDSSAMMESSSGENDETHGEKENTWKLIEQERNQKPCFAPENLTIPSVSMSLSSSPVSNVPSMESLRSSFSQVKHGLSNLAVTFNKVGGISTPDSEVASQWSNISSDSSENNFVPIESLDDEFCRSPLPSDVGVDAAVEVATEVVEDNRSTPSPSFSFGNQMLRAENDNLVGVLTIRLDNVEVAQEAKGTTSKLKFQCRSVSLRECTGMAWNEFQTKFATRNRKWANQVTSTLGSPTQKRVIKMRLSQRIDVEKFKEVMHSDETKSTVAGLRTPECPRVNLTDRPGAESPLRKAIIDSTIAFLDGRVDLRNEDQFTLHMSSTIALADFIEDEICPTPFPIQLEVIGANAELIEDRPSVNITSPGPVPLKFSVPNLPITRDKYGVFHIGYKESLVPPGTSQSASGCRNESCQKDSGGAQQSHKDQQQPSKSELDLILADFEKLQRQLQLVQQRNTELESELQDTQNLKMMILQLQEQVVKLQEEKSNRLNYLR
ncbi:unnamed protein product [Allacma fusca]|uniref:UHRF1-binding protein 1-like n=1 Tax=Allacma fusca TaxID=39272 RepID=A0A8J2NRR7_9HEXA|nr:unnamed protein product [Allacma fusca]